MNAGISTRIAAPLIALSVLFLCVSFGAAWYVHNLQLGSGEIVTNHMASVRAAYELEKRVRDIRRQFFRYLQSGNRAHLEAVPTMRKNTDAWMDDAERLATTPGEQEQMKRVRGGYERFFAEYDRLTKEELPKGAYDSFHDGIESLVRQELFEPTEEFQKINESMLGRAHEENQTNANRLMWGLLGIGTCGAAGGLLMGWVIASSIRRSIQQTEQRLRTTARQLNRVAGGKNTPSDLAPGELDAAVKSVSVSAAAVIERLDRSQRDALRAEQLAYVGQMAAGIAHEVRNPLMAMKILVQKAAERPISHPFQPRDLEVLEAEIERVEHIVRDFLEFARPPQIEKQVLEARPLLERVLHSLSARAEQQQVGLRLVADAKPVYLDVDAGQIQQVFYNLIINALEAMPSGGAVVIDLKAEQPHPEIAPTAVVRVADEGPGLPARLGERIFDPFISLKESGLGLGLSICRRIVEAHGGDLQGTDRPQGGAVFSVRLPAAALQGGILADESPHFSVSNAK